MDIVTQGLIGAAAAQAVASDKDCRTALWIGFLAGLLADIDALFTLLSLDPLLQLEFHRHFTHALIFIPAGGLIAALLLWPFLRGNMLFLRLLLFTTAAYSTSGLLDACTSYGTYLLWPFSDSRIAWNIIAIVDPIFSFTLIAGLWMSVTKRSRTPIFIALACALAYLILGYVQHERVEATIQPLAQERGHQIERIEVKPTLGNILLWRSIYEYDGRFYADAVHAAFNTRTYTGESIPRFTLNHLPALQAGSVQAEDIQRFSYFSDAFLALQDNGHFLGDIRYSMLPTSMRAIWGLELDAEQQDIHPSFVQRHSMSKEERTLWLDMLLGKPR